MTNSDNGGSLPDTPAGGNRAAGNKRRWLLRGLLVFSGLILVAWLIIQPWLWTSAPQFVTTGRVVPPVPVMTMERYSDIVTQHARPYVRQYRHGDSRLLLFGVSNHFDDPLHAEAAQIEALFQQFGPDTCLVESRLGLWISGREGLVRQFGESGLLASLARGSGSELFTLELDLPQEVARVREKHSAEHVALFYVLRPYFGTRRNGPVADPEQFIAEPLHKRVRMAGAAGTISSVADIDRIWQRDFAGLPDWRDCDDRNGWPGLLNDVGSTANEVRNAHWIDVFSALLNGPRPRRVMAVCGCSHVVRLEPALDSLFEKQ